MPNKASDQLFLLINSMTKQEKRYFRIFSSRHSNEKNNYYTLYQVIDRQKEYDEEAIIKLLKSHQFVNRLSIAKTRLYEQLLKSLSSFHAQKSIDSELFFTIQSIEILYSRALYKAAWKKLSSGLKLAQKNEKHAVLLQLSKWKQKLIEKENYQSTEIENIDEWWSDEQKIINQIKEYNSLWYVKSKIFKILFYGGENSSTDLISIKSLMEEYVDPLDLKSLTIHSKFLYFHIQSAYHFATKDLKKSFQFLTSNLLLLQTYSWMFSDNPYAEISILSNLSYIGLKLGMKKEIEPILEKMKKWNKQVEHADENLKIRWFYSYYSIYLMKKINENDCDIADPEIDTIKNELSRLDQKIPILRKSDLKMALSVFYFKADNLRLSLKTAHELLNELSFKQNAKLYFTARLFYLILLIELNKKDYFEVAWNSTKRLIKANQFQSEEVNMLAPIFNRYCKNDDEHLFENIPNLNSPIQNENPFFNFSQWVLSKNNSKENSIVL